MTKALRWMVAVAVMTLVVPAVASAENFYAAVRGGVGRTPDTRSGIAGGEDPIEFKTTLSEAPRGTRLPVWPAGRR